MTTAEQRWLVITDLDGTVLNHHDYDLEAARAAVARCRQAGIPVVLNTSKTYTETLAIRDELQIGDAFIVENGSCIYLPSGSFPGGDEASRRDDYIQLVCGRPQSEISDIMAGLSISPSLYTRLSQCSVDEAVTLTGLAPGQARNAIAREFSEPLLWSGDETQLGTFRRELEAAGLGTLQGGRFLHVIGHCDKGMASRRLLQEYGAGTRSIALGDSPNDAAMLEVADVRVIVSSPSSDRLSNLVDADLVTKQEAPAGWAEAIEYFFEQHLDAGDR